MSDVQVRSSDDLEGVRNLLIRPSVSYFLDAQNTFSAGVAYIGTFSPIVADTTEYRTWQQFIANRKFAGNPLTHRVRLEQRFIERASGSDIYSDRLRYFVRFMLPLAGTANQPFTQGNYIALQNEVFLKISGRSKLNGQLFDQNRAYVSFGRRLNAKVDVEIGYLNQRLNGRTQDTDAPKTRKIK